MVLTRDIHPGANSNSHVWISRDYGKSFENRTRSFMRDASHFARIDTFYASPVDNTKVSNDKVGKWEGKYCNHTKNYSLHVPPKFSEHPRDQLCGMHIVCTCSLSYKLHLIHNVLLSIAI